MQAITRAVPRSLGDCELTYLERRPIDVGRARAEHRAYVDALRLLGVQVTVLPPDDGRPDSVFVEDPLLVLDEVAFALPMGAASRSGELDALATAVAAYREIQYLEPPATIEGGDVLRAGRDLFVGLSRRTNAEGVQRLRAAARPYGYRVHPVRVHGCLHLKTACTRVADRFLINPHWIDADAFPSASLLPLPEAEPFGANTLEIGDAILTMASCPATAELLEKMGHATRPLDLAELQKAEAGLTCLALVFDAAVGA